MRDTIRAYYSLTKPGVLYGNAITTVAGYLFATGRHLDFILFAATVLGSTFVIASACVINNYFDQDIDRLMERTSKRAIIAGLVSPKGALAFGIILGLVGFSILAWLTNGLVVVLGAVGFIDYVFFYAMLSKRLSWHGTLVGSISGAIPVLAGYCAVSGRIDINAALVFLILFFWQMPEFYSIAIYRRKEYAKAKVPVISVVKGVTFTKVAILIYTLAYVICTLLLAVWGKAGYVYLVVMLILGAQWINHGLKAFKAKDSDKWARKMFRLSLVNLLVFSFLISVDTWLP